MRGARPRGCRLSRSTLTGGRSSAGSTPARNGATRRWPPPVSSVGRRRAPDSGSCPSRTSSTAARAAFIAGSSSGRSWKAGAKPAATSKRVALAQRNLEPLRQAQHHVAARRDARSRRSSDAAWRSRPRARGRAGSGAGAGATPATVPGGSSNSIMAGTLAGADRAANDLRGNRRRAPRPGTSVLLNTPRRSTSCRSCARYSPCETFSWSMP